VGFLILVPMVLSAVLYVLANRMQAICDAEGDL